MPISLLQQDLWPQAPCAGEERRHVEPFSQVSVVPPQQPVSFPQAPVFPPQVLDASPHQLGFFPQESVLLPQIPVFIPHSTLRARAFFEQPVALARRRPLPEEDRFVRLWIEEQQLSRLRATRALQIQPTASNVVAYRSRAALRRLLHGLLLELEGWVLLEQQSVSAEVETSICGK